jgi:protein ImuB
MAKRFVSIWFRHLAADHITRRRPGLRDMPFVFSSAERGRKVVTEANAIARAQGISVGMAVADCRAIVPELEVLEHDPEQSPKLLQALAEWCIRYTPVVAMDAPDGLMLDSSGCAHLWGGERAYVEDIRSKLRSFGYDVHVVMADTIGAAWGMSRFGGSAVVAASAHREALSDLPPAALRLDDAILERLEKLGLCRISSFIGMPRVSLRRRFGPQLLIRLDQALGIETETIIPIRPAEPYREILDTPEPIRTAIGIEIALENLLESLCRRFTEESTGLRRCILKCLRIDGKERQIEIGTNRPSRNAEHLFRLFKNKISGIEPGLGIEAFTLEASVVEPLSGMQEALWNVSNSNDIAVAELLDRVTAKLGQNTVRRYLPAEHFWPERAARKTTSLSEVSTAKWRTDMPRPIHLLANPEPIEVTVPIPDYPPMLFRYKGTLYHVRKADGPERIEQEWWLGQGLFRDYYCVEDEYGGRHWLFRLGHYDTGRPQWFIHGFFA